MQRRVDVWQFIHAHVGKFEIGFAWLKVITLWQGAGGEGLTADATSTICCARLLVLRLLLMTEHQVIHQLSDTKEDEAQTQDGTDQIPSVN
ncbi:hypothetical protein D3C79_848920 [compost metagenome]